MTTFLAAGLDRVIGVVGKPLRRGATIGDLHARTDPQRLNVTVSSSAARCVCAELTFMDVSS